MGLRMKNFNITGVHWKIQFLGGGGGSRTNNIPMYRGELTKKGGLDSLQIWERDGLGKKEWGLIPQCTLCVFNVPWKAGETGEEWIKYKLYTLWVYKDYSYPWAHGSLFGKIHKTLASDPQKSCTKIIFEKVREIFFWYMV